MNAYSGKYTNDKLSDLNFKIIAKNSNGEIIYNDTKTTDSNGNINIADEDYFRVTGEITFEIKCLNTPKQFKEMQDITVVVNRDQHPDQTITVDQVKTSSNVKASTEAIRDPHNVSDFTYNVNVDIPFVQKTIKMDLNKISSSSDKINLQGATFTLTQPDGKHTEQETTNEEGKTEFSADVYGEEKEYLYYLVENSAPSGYVAQKDPIPVYVKMNDETVISARIGNDNPLNKVATKDNSVNLKIANDPIGSLFNFRLIERYENKGVEGSKYNITINSINGEKLDVTDYTDENGNIDVTKIPGNGEIVIKINELENAIGYKKFEGEKIVVINKTDKGALSIVEEKTSEDIIVSIDKITNTVIAILQNQPTEKKNLIEYKVVDINDNEIGIKDVSLKTNQPNSTSTTDIVTNQSGIAYIENPNVPGTGSYEYNTVVAGTPDTYYTYNNQIDYQIEYNEDGNIINIEKSKETINVNEIEVKYEVENESDTTTYKAIVEIKPEPKTTYNLKVINTQKDNFDIKIPDSRFKITSIVNNSDSSEAEKITGTDGTFKITQASGNEVTINLEQTQVDKKYVLDTESKKIVLTKDSNGVFEIDENKTTKGLKASITSTGEIEINVENELKGANINFQLVKVDNNNNAIRLEGVKLKLKDETTGKEYEVTTDESGQVLLEGFKVEKPGEYDFTLTEISTVEGYNLPTLQDGETIKFKIVYIEEDGALQVKEVLQDGGENVVTGISYTQTATETEYILQLKLIIENSIKDENKFTVNLHKIDTDSKVTLSGAQFTFKDNFGENGGITAKIETLNNGQASLEIPLVNGENKFTIKEILAPLGYVLDDSEKIIIFNKDEKTGAITIKSSDINTSDITISENTIDIYLGNKKKSTPTKPNVDFYMELNKIDKETESPMSNVEFVVTEIDKETGEEKETQTKIVTNESGNSTLKISNLQVGNTYVYKISENTVTGYKKIKDIKIEVTVGNNGAIENVELLEENDAIKDLQLENGIGKIIIENEREEYDYYWDLNKIDKDTQLPMRNVEFKITEIEEETEEEKGNKGVLTTDENGHISFKIEKVKAGTYVYKLEETKISGYKAINEIKVKVTIGENGRVEKVELLEENEAVKNFLVENGQVKIIIENEREEYDYDWNLYKIDKDTQLPMKNVEFKVTRIDEETGEEKGNSGIFTTDENGHISFKIEKVKAGTYVYKLEETKISGYKAINEIKVKVTIGEDGRVEKVELLEENEAVKDLLVENGQVKL